MLQLLFDNVAGDTVNVKVLNGYGTPEGAVVANVGSLFQRIDGSSGTSLYLKESGTGATGWVEIGSAGGSGTPGGADTEVQFNDGGTFGGDPQLTFQKTTNTLTANSFAVNATEASVASDFPLAFNGVTGDTKIVYEVTDTYLRIYLNGVLRCEM